MPWTVTFFKLHPQFHQLVGLYRLLSKRKENPRGEVEKVLEKSRKTLETE